MNASKLWEEGFTILAYNRAVNMVRGAKRRLP